MTSNNEMTANGSQRWCPIADAPRDGVKFDARDQDGDVQWTWWDEDSESWIYQSWPEDEWRMPLEPQEISWNPVEYREYDEA